MWPRPKHFWPQCLYRTNLNNYPAAQKGRPYLPALVCSAIVGVVFGDVGIDATESQLFVRCRRDSLDYQLCIGIRWLGLILDKRHTGVIKTQVFICMLYKTSFLWCCWVFTLGLSPPVDSPRCSPPPPLCSAMLRLCSETALAAYSTANWRSEVTLRP